MTPTLRCTGIVWSDMISAVTLLIFASLVAQQADWITAGNRALDKGDAAEAAACFARALDAKIRAGASVRDQTELRITLATAYLEAGTYRETEAVLQQAHKSVSQTTDGLVRAALL